MKKVFLLINMKTLLATIIALTPVSAMADTYQEGYASSKTCYKQTYREEYVPGTKEDPGFVRFFNETIEVPCKRDIAGGGYGGKKVIRQTEVTYDDNDCSDGKIAGGLLGGGAAAAMSRGDGRWWAIPLGVVAGATIGCDIDGG